MTLLTSAFEKKGSRGHQRSSKVPNYEIGQISKFNSIEFKPFLISSDFVFSKNKRFD